MTGFADANLVIAAVDSSDALHERARAHLRRVGRLRVPFSVAIELLVGAHDRGLDLTTTLAAMAAQFDIDDLDTLGPAARAIQEKEIPTTFDALHLAYAWSRGGELHTADKRLRKGPFPTVGW